LATTGERNKPNAEHEIAEINCPHWRANHRLFVHVRHMSRSQNFYSGGQIKLCFVFDAFQPLEDEKLFGNLS